MKTSCEVVELYKALISFQGQVKPIKKCAKANYGKYARLEDIQAEVNDKLIGVGLGYVQEIGVDAQANKVIVTRIFHESGQWMECTGLFFMDKASPQGYGSGTTYAKRYGLTTALGLIVEGEDDDGQTAEKENNNKPDDDLEY